MMMYETAMPLESEEDMTDGIIWEANTVFVMETDGLCLSSWHCYGWGWAGPASFSGRLGMLATLPSVLAFDQGGVLGDTNRGICGGVECRPQACLALTCVCQE